MPAKRIDFREWFLRVVHWNGFLPIAIAIIPRLFSLVFPKLEDVVAVTAVILPPIVFFWRIASGYRLIFSNRCGYWLRHFQLCVFVVGLVPLILIDCLIILSAIIPNGMQGDEDLRIWLIMLAIYFASMAIAMYPGRKEIPADEWEQYFARDQG